MIMWIVVFLSFLLPSATAFANCQIPDPRVLGTFPEDGGTNVPINSKFIIYTPSRAKTASLNGQPLAREMANIWSASSDLDPNTSYTLVFELSTVSDDSLFHEVSFQTGSDRVQPPEAPVVHSYDVYDSELVEDDDCRYLVLTTGCADSDPPPFLRFDVEGDGDFFITNVDGHPEFHQLWPKHCGMPSWEGYGGPCFEVYAIENGQLSEPTQVCDDPPRAWEPGPNDLGNNGNVDVGNSEGCGCQSVGGFLPGMFGLLTLMFWLRRRS